MKYTASLEGRNGKIYTADIVTKGDATVSKELTFVANGLVVRLDSTEDLFAPVLGGSATLTFLVDELYSDMYSPGATDVPVAIYEDEELLFSGYVLPNAYSQELPNGKIELTIECRDALSALQDIKYNGESANMSIMDYLTNSLDKVKGDYPLTISVAEPFLTSINDMVVQSANWYDEAGEPMSMAEVLSSCMQWLNVRLYQWRDKWIITDIRAIAQNTVNIDDYSANNSISFSLSETYNKVKASVSLYNGGAVLDDIFEDANYLNNETWRKDGLKGEPRKFASVLGFYQHPQVTQRMYITPFIDWIPIENNADAMAEFTGAWLVRQYSSRVMGSVTPEEESNEPKNYLVLTNPIFQTPWRMIYNTDGELYRSKVLAVIEDTQERIFTAKDILVISGSAILSRIPAPLLCPTFGGGIYYPDDGDYKEDRAMAYPPAIVLRISVGDKELGSVSGGVFGWNNDKSDPTYTNRYPIYLWSENNKKDVWNIAHQIPDTVYRYYGSDLSGAGIFMADNLVGKLKVEILGFAAEDIDSMWIQDFSFNIKKALGGRVEEWFNASATSDDDIEYQSEVLEKSVKEAPEVSLKVATNAGSDYSRSIVFSKETGVLLPVNELTSSITGEVGIAEHHLIDARVKQFVEPRMKLFGTWRNMIASPSIAYYSAEMGKTMICNGVELNLHSSESALNLEEIIL